ncbi:MAG: hypothetical protein ABSG63_00060 [Spirochaetia bacterium]
MAEVKKGMLADLLDETFHIMGRTWPTSLLLGAVLFFPTSWFFGWAYGRFFDALARLAQNAGAEPTSTLVLFGTAYLWILLAALLQALVLLFVRACVTAHAALAVRNVPASPLTIMVEIALSTYPRLLGQRILQGAILVITLTAGMLLTGVAVGVAAALKATALAIVLGIILGIASIGAYVWALVRFSLTLESLVIDGMKIEPSLDQSALLIRGAWWRVFGCILLFGLMVSFASSILATPILFFASIRQYGELLRSLLQESSGEGSFNATLLRLLAGMGRKLGLMAYLQSLLSALVSPVFMTMLFFAMKKRRDSPAQVLTVSAPPAAGESAS